MRLIKFDGKYSDEGCDIIKLEGNMIYLVEVKSCNISPHDAGVAIKQLDFTEKWLHQNYQKLNCRLRKHTMVVKVFLHDKKGGHCGMYGHMRFKQKHILRPSIADSQWKQVLAFAKRKS